MDMTMSSATPSRVEVVTSVQRRVESLVLLYAKENGNASCSAIINKHLRDLEFLS